MNQWIQSVCSNRIYQYSTILPASDCLRTFTRRHSAVTKVSCNRNNREPLHFSRLFHSWFDVHILHPVINSTSDILIGRYLRRTCLRCRYFLEFLEVSLTILIHVLGDYARSSLSIWFYIPCGLCIGVHNSASMGCTFLVTTLSSADCLQYYEAACA